MKKIIALSLVGIISLLGLAGCAKKSDISTNSGQPVEVSMVVFPNVERPYNNDLPVVKAWEAKTNVKIKFVSPGNYDVMLASKDIPDIIRNSVRDQFVKYNNILEPLDKLIDSSAPNIKKLYSENEEVKKISTIDNQIKYLTTYSFSSAPEGFIIRKDWLDKVGMDVPKTTDDWYNVLKAFKGLSKDTSADKSIIPFSTRSSVNGGRYAIMGLVEAFGVSEGLASGKGAGFFIEGDKIYHGPTHPNMKNALIYLNKLYKEGLIDNQYLVTDTSKWQNNFSNERSGATNDYATRVDFLNGLVKPNNSKVNFVNVLPPTNKDGGIWSGRKTSSVIPGGLAIYKGSKVKEAAIRLIDYLYSDEGSKLANLGIEREHYNMVDGKVKFTDLLTNNSSGKSAQQLAWTFGINSFGPTKPLGIAENIFYSEQYRNFTKDYTTANVQGTAFADFNFNADELELITTKYNDIKTYCDEKMDKFIMGNEPIENFDKFVSEVKKMGIDDIVRIYNDAYTRYKNAK